MFPNATYVIQEQERGLAPQYHAEGAAPSAPSSPAQRSGETQVRTLVVKTLVVKTLVVKTLNAAARHR